jgi:hypothetical protein
MNTNFSGLSLAPIAVMGLLAAVLGLCLSAAVIAGALLMRRRKIAIGMVVAASLGAIFYAAILLGLSLLSQDRVLAPGAEKYFCEIDCHLAYAVVDVQKTRILGSGPTAATAGGVFYVVSLRTRFDENTIGPQRPRTAPLTPNPRNVELVGTNGESYGLSTAGQAALSSEKANPSLMTPLIPGEQYVTRLVFDAPANLSDPRLLLTSEGWDTHWMIGEENSWLHKKTWLGLGNISAGL